MGGDTLTVAFGQRVVTVVLRSAEPRERGENNHKKHKVTECQRQTESRGDETPLSTWLSYRAAILAPKRRRSCFSLH